MILISNAILLSLHYYIGYNVYCTEYENQYGPEYGENWIKFVDDHGTSHTVNFTTIPSDTRNMIFGDAYFHLYTRRNREREELTIDDDKINSTYLNPSNDIKILTHGWLSSESSEWLQKMKNSLLKKGDFNVIIVDWSDLAENPAYPWSALSTRYVGKRVAKLLHSLDKSYNIRDRNVHLIGHSLGAQVMGYAGMFSELQVHRITGMDPARPLFEIPLMGKDFRLDKSDAIFVDIIHTCGGIYGYKYSHGDADFYPNKGQARQPGCEGIQVMIEMENQQSPVCPRRPPSQRQMEALVDFLERNPGIAKGLLRTQQGKRQTRRKWQEFATAANALGGLIKDGPGWAKYWTEKKCALRAAISKRSTSMRRTGGGVDVLPELTALEQRIMAVCGPDFAKGDSGLAVDPFPNNSLQPSPSVLEQPSTSSADTEPLMVVIVADPEAQVEDPPQALAEASQQVEVRLEREVIDTQEEAGPQVEETGHTKACSHGRSYEFFDESINSDIFFTSYPCESWDKFKNGKCRTNPSHMGYPASLDSEGDYYLYTRDKPKYAMED